MTRPDRSNAANPRTSGRERAAPLRRHEAARERRTKMLTWGVPALVVLVLAGGVAVAVVRNRTTAPSLAVRSYADLGRNHVEGPQSYPQTPPVGGDHNATWLKCGVYDKPAPNENAVHSLEHGAVWVTYRPDLPSDQVQTLRQEVDGPYLILSPSEGIPAPVVASAWGKQLNLTGASDPRLKAFIKAYRQGPQTPEPGAVCTGGTDGTGAGGTPLGDG